VGELAIVRAREKAEKTLGAKFNIRAFHDAVRELGSVPLPVVTALIDRFITENGKGRIWSEQAPVATGADAGKHGDHTRLAETNLIARIISRL
jgi:hypothetical protein